MYKYDTLKLEGSRMGAPLGITNLGFKLIKNNSRTPGRGSIVELWKSVK